MAASKRPGSKKHKRKSKARQTTLTSFTVPQSVLEPAIVASRRSTRRTGPVVDTLPDVTTPPPAVKPSKKMKKPKQQIIRLGKSPGIIVPTLVAVAGPPPPSIHAPKSPNFAVVIHARSKKSLEQPTQATGSWFQPGVRLNIDQHDQGNVLPTPEQEFPLDKGKGKEIAPQSTGNTTDEDTDPVLTPAKKRRGSATKTLDDTHNEFGGANGKGNKKPKSLARTKAQVEDDSSSEVITPKNKRTRQSKGDKPPQASCGNDSAVSATRKKPKGKGKQVELKEIGNDDPVTPVARRNTSKGKDKKVASKEPEDTSKPSEHKGASGDEDSDQDRQDDLTILSQKRNVLSSRTRYNGSSPKKTPFQKKLAELRAKKDGKQIRKEDSDDDKPRRALYDTDDEDQDEPESHDDDDDDDDDGQSSSDVQSDSDGWIIEDGGNTHDVQIPIEFTHLSHQSEQQNFKIFCLWVVQSILNPDFPRDNEVSQYAIRALERKMDSYGGSVLQSSIWKAPFMRAMRARPSLGTEICDERPNCDACGMGKRPATHAVTFSGNRYDRETLEDLEDSEADDSEDSAGLNIPSENDVFYLGRNCHQRARMSHAFIHWKKELRDEIHGLLQEKGYFSPFWVNKAAKMETAERTKWANIVTDDLDDVIKALYADLKKGLQEAQSNMTNQRSGRWR